MTTWYHVTTPNNLGCTQAFLPPPVIVEFSSCSSVVWREDIWCVLGMITPSSYFSGVAQMGQSKCIFVAMTKIVYTFVSCTAVTELANFSVFWSVTHRTTQYFPRNIFASFLSYFDVDMTTALFIFLCQERKWILPKLKYWGNWFIFLSKYLVVCVGFSLYQLFIIILPGHDATFFLKLEIPKLLRDIGA